MAKNMSDASSVINMLKTALKMEEKGYKIYIQTARRTDNPLVQKVFNTLARDEMLHIKTINKFYHRALKLLIKLDLPSLLKVPTKEEDKDKIFGIAIKKLKQEISLSKDDDAVYKFALAFETKGYEFYKNALYKTKDDNLRKLLIFLTEQENEHYRFLQETHEYLTDPASWFIKEEKPIYEGG